MSKEKVGWIPSEYLGMMAWEAYLVGDLESLERIMLLLREQDESLWSKVKEEITLKIFEEYASSKESTYYE